MRLNLENSPVGSSTMLLVVSGVIDWSTIAQFRAGLSRLMSCPRPDILVEQPDGKVYGVNVGLMEDSGAPILREREAISDLMNSGTYQGKSIKMFFVGYGYESDFDPVKWKLK